MLLSGKIAIVYGGGGFIGAAAARAFAREGAHVVLVGRTAEPLARVAKEIADAGGSAETAQVDALDSEAIDAHAETVIRTAGRIDVSMNATSIRGDLQGTPLRDMSVDDFTLPARTALRSNFNTATAAARRMVRAAGDVGINGEDSGSGIILTMSSTASALSGRERRFHATGGFGVGCAAIEEFTRSLAGDVSPYGVRVVCLRSDALPETWRDVETEPVQSVYQFMRAGTALNRMPTLHEVGEVAAFVASDRASAMTGTIVNLTCGSMMNAH